MKETSQEMQTAERQLQHLLFLGYFDRGNLGDNAMRDGLKHYATSRWPAAEQRWIPLPRFSLRTIAQFQPVLTQLRWADAVVLAGGTHFHDAFGRRSIRILISHLALFWVARVFGTVVGYAGIGVGPLKSRVARRLTSQLLSAADSVLVRDHQSMELVRSLRPRTTIHRGFDSATLLTPSTRNRNSQRHILGISILPYFSLHQGAEELDNKLIESLTMAITGVYASFPNLEVRIFVFYQGERDSDLPISRRLLAALKPDIPASIHPCLDPRQTLDEFAELNALIATRYHAAMLGYLASCPMLIVSYQEKCTSLSVEIGLPPHAVLEPHNMLDATRLSESLHSLLGSPECFLPSLPATDLAKTTWDGLEAFASSLSHKAGKGTNREP